MDCPPFIAVEYNELCRNVRESWNYIQTLLRQFLFFQLFLLTLVGFVNSAITPTGTSYLGAPVSQSSISGLEANAAVREKEAFVRDAKFKQHARNFTIFVLILIGGGLSVGAWRQSHRLFINATAFVRRAAAIENTYSSDLVVEKVTIHPMHRYMLDRLTDQHLFKMENALSAAYVGGIVVWVCMAGLFGIPLVV